MDLTCTECGKTTKVNPARTVAGLDVSTWFITVQGRRCTPCRKMLEELAAASTPEAKFKVFDEYNPHVYKRLVAMAQPLLKRGFKRIGIRMLWETLRYEHMTTADPNSTFKLNDHYHSFYARKMVAEHPEFAGVIELRERSSALS